MDGLDIKATTAPLIVRRSTFRNADPNNSNADAIDFGPGAGRVESCLIHDFPDKGVSIGGAPGSYITNTVIYRCGIGISAYASTNLVFEDTTITACLNGILFRDNPTRAVGWGTNLIIWGNQTNIAIQNTSILNMEFTDVEGVIHPGTGNISIDPLFVDAHSDDFRLLPNSPARGTGINGTDMGAKYPVGGIPARPEKLVAKTIGTNYVQLTWIDASANEDGHIIQRSADGINWEIAGNSIRNSDSFIDVSNLNLYYRVRATNDIGLSEFSNTAKAHNFDVPSLQIERNEGNQLAITAPVEPGISYILQTRESLAAGSWVFHSNIPAQPGSEQFRILIPAEGFSRYFRLVVE